MGGEQDLGGECAVTLLGANVMKQERFRVLGSFTTVRQDFDLGQPSPQPPLYEVFLGLVDRFCHTVYP